LSDAVTGGKDIGHWLSNIPERMREYWLKNEKLFFKHDVPQHRKDRNSSQKWTTNLIRRQNYNAEVVERSWLRFSPAQVTSKHKHRCCPCPWADFVYSLILD